MRTDTKKQFEWTGRMEQLEDRHLMSANPLGGFLGGAIEPHVGIDEPPALTQHVESTPDFWIEAGDQDSLDDQSRQIENALLEANAQTGLDNVRANYGFTGIGQTVAVIDSGIAYDQVALGGGFGAGYRVVGGWDFTGENDANPYDDGPSGGHGTHVAGIVGGSGTGVAPGVDLVALRVFDDAGAGYFSWVENALNWVHDNKNSFENPITTVNLSLGVSGWNAETIPSWANLEDEFAHLEADGIFIAVSAGNSFTSYNAAGLSYPAASSYVIPVMSTDDNGQLSYFSQRSTRAIAAPGRWITSTVPDYSGNNDGINDDYATMSGTSMAAPYVAGASMLVREAMEFVGYTNITQDMIYNQMMATADSVFDSVTNQSYSRLNLEAAIDDLMPTDDYGSTVASAYNLGAVNGPMAMSGAIATLGDVDYFSFTAGSTGTVTFETTNTTNNLAASWLVNGTQSLSVLAVDGSSLTVNVVAGQEYTVGFSSSDGLGYYDFNVTSASSFTFTDWGAVSFSQLQGVSATNDTWYRIEATSNGYLTAEGLFDVAGGQISLELYDTNLTQVDTGNAVNGQSRVDTYATAGEEFFVRVLGSNADVDFRLTNLVTLSGTTVNVAGTSAADTFSFAAGNTHQVSVNGVTYGFASIAITEVNFDGGAGVDSITMTGTAGDEMATLRVGDATLVGAGFTVNALNVEDVDVYGGGGNDRANLYDSVGDDLFTATPDSASLVGSGYDNRVTGFSRVYAYATAGGDDSATLYDSAGDDSFKAYSTWARFAGNGYYNYAQGFDRVDAYATAGGNDRAYLYDSSGNDRFYALPEYAVILGENSEFANYARGFDRVDAYATAGGNDRAYLYDSSGNDRFYGLPEYAVMVGENSEFINYARGFGRVDAYATAGGNDRATLYDSSGDDRFYGLPEYAVMVGENSEFINYARGFDRVDARATAGGNDRATLYDSAGNDLFYGLPDYAVMLDENSEFYNYVRGFDRVDARATAGGNDRAYLYDSAGNDLFYGLPDYAVMLGANSEFYNYVRGFGQVNAYATAGGTDQAFLYDSLGNDILRVGTDSQTLEGNGYYNFAKGFEQTNAFASSGYDQVLIDRVYQDESLFGQNNLVQVTRQTSTQNAYSFDKLVATVEGGAFVDVDPLVIDYLYEEFGAS
ncbi:MAG: S8 family serine peptidase [Planctomycetes bacterium]|nr:S8 family serine peptidase [Planctomycetota bacterium]